MGFRCVGEEGLFSVVVGFFELLAVSQESGEVSASADLGKRHVSLYNVIVESFVYLLLV